MLDDLESLELYKKYLNTIQKVLDGYFEEQKEYICCKKGCSKCCETGTYPFSKIEFDYIISGFFRLERTVQMEIIKRINEIKSEYLASNDKKNFVYRCPFLDDEGICTVYEYRGLICRNFGLIQNNTENKLTLPFCYKYGLNFSKIYNPDTKKFDLDKIKSEGYKTMPKDYKISLNRLMDINLFENESFEFGEVKPLIEWIQTVANW